MFKFLLFILIIFSSNTLKSEESLLTLKQQLDRLQREVSDLSQSLFTQSNINQIDKSEIKENSFTPSSLTAFDLRIYDLEKDLKKLNENFENIIFEIDDLKTLINNLSLDISSKLIDKNIDIDQSKIIKNEKKDDSKNTLGTIVINSEDLSNDQIITNEENENLNDNPVKLSLEEEYQNAFDMIRNQEFSNAKIAFQNFIKAYPENKLSGSAHYWLGEIFILKKEYRESALILAEGFQKFPKSVKAPDMLYKLSESLININKIENACSTLNKLIKEFSLNKLSIKAQDRRKSLNCNIDIE